MRNPSSEAPRGTLAHPTPLDGVHPVEDWADAQAHLNFVAVAPKAGSSWRVTEATVRGESATHYSTVRLFLEDADGRRLRVKEYYNDWWIPTIPDISFRKPGRPIVMGDEVAFVGRDYRRNDGSCGHRYGTSVEFSLEKGAMDDAAWAALWSAMEPAVPGIVPEARRTPYAKRSYWNRWNRANAPWDSTEISSLTWSTMTSEAMERVAWAITPDRWASIPGAIDSVGWRDGPLGPEMQAVFWRPHDLNVSAWLRVLREAPKDWRPLIDAGEVNRPSWTRIRLGDVEVERAAMSPEVGNWMYAWRKGKLAYELHMRARRLFLGAQADVFARGVV